MVKNKLFRTILFYLSLNLIWFLTLKFLTALFSIDCICLPRKDPPVCVGYEKFLLFKIDGCCGVTYCATYEMVVRQYLKVFVPPTVVFCITLILEFFTKRYSSRKFIGISIDRLAKLFIIGFISLLGLLTLLYLVLMLLN